LAPIKAAVLEAVLEAHGHGYDIVTRTNERMGTWGIESKQVYEPLKQLERDGLVWSRKEPCDEPPGYRKVYYSTDAARPARQDWLASRPTLGVLRADFHVRVAFSTRDDAPDLFRGLGEYREDLLESIEENARTWAPPEEDSWLRFAIGHLRAEVDKQRKAEIEWVNDFSAELKERMPRALRRHELEHRRGRWERMTPTKAAVLAALLEEAGHGYGVATRTNQRMGTWGIKPKRIYDPLKALENDGLLWSRREPIPDPPGYRKVYYPTSNAPQARQRWYGSRPMLGVLRADFHVRVAFSTEDDVPDLLRALSEYREDLLESIEENARTWAAPKASWLGFAIRHLRAEVDKQRKAEIEWINDFAEDLELRMSGES
jgi:DNA-binding PadR family transcriptional regulator